jgi:hypothetical protein
VTQIAQIWQINLNGGIPVENQITPPKGLKGIDLIIWKLENGI